MLPAFPVVLVAVLHLQVSLVEGAKWDHTRPIVTVFADRNGHNYLFRYDYHSSKQSHVHTGVAVRVGLNEITFSQYSFQDHFNKQSCITFLTLRGSENTCNRFFLLADDWYKFERRTWDKGFGVSGCKMIQFYNSVLVYIKYDVQDDTSPKFVGTYSMTRDRLYYIDHHENRVMINNFKRRISAGIMSPTKYEVVCASDRK